MQNKQSFLNFEKEWEQKLMFLKYIIIMLVVMQNEVSFLNLKKNRYNFYWVTHTSLIHTLL